MNRFSNLDALRGVAALMVVLYHVFEAIAFAAGAPEQQMYHGFLAVDFFFVLSGFVMGYAYDERLRTGRMSSWNFVKRRLIRLHPMVVWGVIIGAVAFILQGCTTWDGRSVGFGTLSVAILLALFLIPTPARFDVRGNTEMLPLNGPHWSLFFEYLGSWAYVILLRRLRTRYLALWVGIAAIMLSVHALFIAPDHSIAYGWSVVPSNMAGGALRILFAYPMGLLLSRLHKVKTWKIPMGTAFVFLPLLLMMPSLSTPFNAIYQLFTVCVAFPLIVWAGAGVQGKSPLPDFLGRLSYPLYAVHYPLIYIYIHYLQTNVLSPTIGSGMVVFVAALVLGILSLKVDEAVRKSPNFIPKNFVMSK